MSAEHSTIIIGDCLNVLKSVKNNSCDVAYLDPPFFTGKTHHSSTRDGNKVFSFDDVWPSTQDYVSFLEKRLIEVRRVLKDTGSIFVHGDHNNIHLARTALDKTFGESNFVSEIIWYYKRWSNAKKGLLQLHQNILFYSKTKQFKWNSIYTDYSATTNIDQIMQQRSRDDRGKAIYSKDENGHIIYAQEKKGVPLGDVWEIPFLNPKAKERTGYPTQKPILLLERIIGLTTNEGDTVLDPFCGSGTSLVTASLMKRNYIGIDISEEAIQLTKKRLSSPVRTESRLMQKGIKGYINNDPWVEAHLAGLEYIRVHRNSGIDALLKQPLNNRPCFIRVQREREPLIQVIAAIRRATINKGDVACMVIKTADDLPTINDDSVVHIIESSVAQVAKSALYK